MQLNLTPDKKAIACGTVTGIFLILISSILGQMSPFAIGVQSLVFMVLISPIWEEIFFRAVIQNLLEKYTGHSWIIAGLAQGAVYGALHFPSASYLMVGYIAFAIVMSLLYKYTKNLSSCILAHMIFNAFMVSRSLI